MYEEIVRLLDEARFTKIGPPRVETVGEGETLTFGYLAQPYHGFREMKANRDYPVIWERLRELGNALGGLGFQWNGITVNRNLQCPRNLDKKNVGRSMFMAIGN